MKTRVTFFARIVIIALFFAGFPQKAEAVIMTGDALLSMCTSKNERDLFSCQSYIAGVVDYHVLIKGLGTAPSVDFCIPDAAKMNDLRLVVASYLQKNQQHASFVASPAVALALYDMFPCR